MVWPFRKAIEEHPLEPPVPVYERECICGSRLFHVFHGIYERGATLGVTPPARVKCVRCGRRTDDTNWAAMTRRVEK